MKKYRSNSLINIDKAILNKILQGKSSNEQKGLCDKLDLCQEFIYSRTLEILFLYNSLYQQTKGEKQYANGQEE